MQGKITRILTSYGFIEVEGKEKEKDLFFHKSEAPGFYDLKEGDAIEFEEGVGKKGDTVATKVEKIETEEDSEEE